MDDTEGAPLAAVRHIVSGWGEHLLPAAADEVIHLSRTGVPWSFTCHQIPLWSECKKQLQLQLMLNLTPRDLQVGQLQKGDKKSKCFRWTAACRGSASRNKMWSWRSLEQRARNFLFLRRERRRRWRPRVEKSPAKWLCFLEAAGSRIICSIKDGELNLQNLLFWSFNTPLCCLLKVPWGQRTAVWLSLIMCGFKRKKKNFKLLFNYWTRFWNWKSTHIWLCVNPWQPNVRLGLASIPWLSPGSICRCFSRRHCKRDPSEEGHICFVDFQRRRKEKHNGWNVKNRWIEWLLAAVQQVSLVTHSAAALCVRQWNIITSTKLECNVWNSNHITVSYSVCPPRTSLVCSLNATHHLSLECTGNQPEGKRGRKVGWEEDR